MPLAINVNGPCRVDVSLNGTFSGATPLCISEDGVGVSITKHRVPVMTDAAGPEVPADLQDVGEDATLKFRMPAYDPVVWESIQRVAGAAREGRVDGVLGRLIGSGGFAFLTVLNAPLDRPYRFYSCTLQNVREVKLGTRYKAWDVEIYAWMLVGSSDTPDRAVLYDRGP